MPSPGYELADGYRIELLSESSDVTEGDVISFWEREGALSGSEAAARVREVLHVATDRKGNVAGVSTAYLQRNAQLRMELWHQRGFVSPEHRKANIGMLFAIIGQKQLQDRFVTGQDTRGQGLILEIENEGIKRYFNRGTEPSADSTFIGENEPGDHVRVHYFPGARAPEPPEARP